MASKSFDHFIEFINHLKELDIKEKDILTRRLKKQTLNQIGKKYGLTGERIRQIENQALKKLKTTICQLRLLD